MATPWHWQTRLLLIDPPRIERRLQTIRDANMVDQVPNLWQITQGARRMWHRIVFRQETIGNCTEFPRRGTWRARLLEAKAVRGPVLLAARAVTPWDLSGLLSSREQIIRHLLGAHHDGVQAIYDLEMLVTWPDALDELATELRAVVDGSHPRARWLRDLVVYDHYHENLLELVLRVIAGEEVLSYEQRHDPDISFRGYLDWCAAQPDSPEASVQASARRA